jgi:quinol monooxygenase YgiN
MSRLQATAVFPNIAAADLEEFKLLAAKALEVTTPEAGNLQYDWFFNADETKCLVRETYESSEAVLVHMGNMGVLLEQLAKLGGGLEIEVFGVPSAELTAALGAHLPVYRPFQSK